MVLHHKGDVLLVEVFPGELAEHVRSWPAPLCQLSLEAWTPSESATGFIASLMAVWSVTIF